MATLTRRTEKRTWAPILRSFVRIVPRSRVGYGRGRSAQRAHQHVGERREPKAQLVGGHRRGGGAVGEEIELALLDPVLHVAARAIQLFVEGAGWPAIRLQRGHNEAWVGLVAAPFGLADHPTPS